MLRKCLNRKKKYKLQKKLNELKCKDFLETDIFKRIQNGFECLELKRKIRELE
jgi:hypothetical protein